MLSFERLPAEDAPLKPALLIPLVKSDACVADLKVILAFMMSSVIGDENLLRVPNLKPVHHQYLV